MMRQIGPNPEDRICRLPPEHAAWLTMAALLAGIARALHPEGDYLMQGIAGSSYVHNNMDHPIGPFLYMVSIDPRLCVNSYLLLAILPSKRGNLLIRVPETSSLPDGVGSLFFVELRAGFLYSFPAFLLPARNAAWYASGVAIRRGENRLL